MRPTHTSIASLAALLAAATLATPASARPIESPAQPARTDPAYKLPGDFRTADVGVAGKGRGAHSAYELPRDFRTADVREAAKGRGTFNAPAVTVVKVAEPAPSPVGGLDWADAAVGAAGAAGLLTITLAGAMTMRRRQQGARARAAVS
jgi:hypothetical protein